MNVLGKALTLAAIGAIAVHYGARAASRPAEERDRRLKAAIQRHLATRLADGDAGAIEVVVNSGIVSLRGEIRAEEVEDILSSVLDLPGVRHVHNRLTPQEPGVPHSTIQDAMHATLQ